MQRLRLTYGRDERLKYISHLDMMRLWQRVFRRAEIHLAYSQGYNPHPKLSTAAPLAVGTTSDCELMDVYLEPGTEPGLFLQSIVPQLPAGLWVTDAVEVPGDSASLAAALRFAEYTLGLITSLTAGEIESRIASVLTSSTLPRERKRDGHNKRYDLRPLIDDLKLVDDSVMDTVLWMRLQANPTAAGRPEEVVAALGIEAAPSPIKRTGLILER
ncbi:MAG: TIGR03936 family radical SAM-associated protein [Dehalococcoidia bacterium]|nr:TIGR03936 family radical SAM-associated protein [Dehalococcoidia bacterium]